MGLLALFVCDNRRRASRHDVDLVHHETVLGINRFVAGREIGLAEQPQEFVRAIAAKDIVGIQAVHIGNGWIFSSAGGGWEYPAFLIAASFALWLLGDGAFALRSRPLWFVGQQRAALA